MKNLYTWICIFSTVCASATGDVLIALAMRRIGDLGQLHRNHGFLRVITRVLSGGALFGGIFFMALAFFSNLVGLSWADLSLMGPASAALTFVANAVAAKLFLHENVDRRRWVATIFVCGGVLLFYLFLSSRCSRNQPSPTAVKITSGMSINSSTAPLIQSTQTQPSSRPRIGFVSLGCPKNLVDSEVMMGMLSTNGAEITARAEDADIIVVNTCSFIDAAKQESVDTILEMAEHKIHGRARKLIVTGCLVERYRDEIQKNIPQVDAVLGTGELADILAAAGIAPAPVESTPFTILNGVADHAAHSHPSASQQLKGGQHQPASRPEGDAREQAGRFARDTWDGARAELPSYLYDENTPRLLATARHSAYIKIAEGCDHPCSFCIIPQLRGKFRSRTIASVVIEAQRLASQGVREINLIGQDTTCFGEDLGLQDGLAALLEQLAQIEDLRWVRFLYAYPNKITPRLLEVLAKYPRLCRYIDVPMQHAAPPVLKRMKRGGSAEIFLKLISKMRQAVPDLTLRTSFLVGFPGETEDDFQQLCDFVTAAQFDWLGVFAYSDEEGSPAFNLGDKVPSKEIERRRRKLMQLQKRISRKRRKQWIGREIEVMLEGPSEETELLWEARTTAHAPEIDGKVFINDFGDHQNPQAGSFHRAIVEEAHDYDLVARLL